MKKTIIALVLFSLAVGAFAQKISLDTHLSTSTFYPVLESGIVLPSVGIAVDVGPVDILGNFELAISQEKTKIGSEYETNRETLFGFYAGVAPKASPADKVTLSFPFFMKIYVISDRVKYSTTPDDDDPKRFTRGGFGFEAGARTAYALTPKWSAYLGVQAEILSFYGKGRTTTFGGKKSDGRTSNFYVFSTGYIDLGVKYTFN